MRGWALGSALGMLAAAMTGVLITGTASAATASNTLSYHGGPLITTKPKVYLVFWGSQWGTVSTDSSGNLRFGNDTAGAAGAVQQLIKGFGTGGEHDERGEA